MNDIVDVTKLATEGSLQLFEYGVLGIMLVFSLILNIVLGVLLWRTRTKHIDHLEDHYANQN